MSRMLITIGAALLALGLAWPWLARMGLGRLPGDISVTRGNVSFHFPIVTCLLLSVVASAVLWFLRR